MKLTILSDNTFEFTPAMLFRIQEAVPDAQLIYHPAAAVTATHLAGTEILFGCPAVTLLKQMPDLAWHHLPNAAIYPYTRPDIYATMGVTLTNSSGIYGAPIAEHVAGMVLALARCFPLYARRQQEQYWQRDDYGCVWVENSTISVFGMGDLGSNISRKLKALGAHIIGVRRSLLEKPPYVDELFDLRATKDVLARSDFAICCLPLTSATRGVFSYDVLSCLKPRSYFVNVGRGGLVDTEALMTLLQQGNLAGAALDVTDPEPLPKGHPLWTMDNVLITPHASCVCDDIQERKLVFFLQQLSTYKEGRRLKNQVNFLHGY